MQKGKYICSIDLIISIFSFPLQRMQTILPYSFVTLIVVYVYTQVKHLSSTV